jgi:predicted small metal-binding protein
MSIRPAIEIRTRALFPNSSREVAAFFPTLAIVVAMQTTNKPVRCDCGHEVRAGSEEELLAAVRMHARDEHGIEFTREDALLVLLRAELDESLADSAAGLTTTDQEGTPT